ncbi:MAG: hypothetical protein EXR52_04650 [Dehalococcoidia bacterium]|nr:hypothetical protein [Dehalococcoidia bacterium]
MAASLQELSTDAEHNAESAERVQGLSAKNREAVVEGVASVERLTDAIQRIKASSDETSKIVKSIDEIAFQTNLLALNAAVEAAHGGEAGRGFAVVAEEVRNLAPRSAEAARTTAHLIDGALSHAQAGVELNDQVLDQLGRIRSRVEVVTNAIGDVVQSSQNQRRGVSEVRVAVDQINVVTPQNAAHAEESAASAQDLLEQADALRELVAASPWRSSTEFAAARHNQEVWFEDKGPVPYRSFAMHRRSTLTAGTPKQPREGEIAQNYRHGDQGIVKRQQQQQRAGHRRRGAPGRQVGEQRPSPASPLDGRSRRAWPVTEPARVPPPWTLPRHRHDGLAQRPAGTGQPRACSTAAAIWRRNTARSNATAAWRITMGSKLVTSVRLTASISDSEVGWSKKAPVTPSVT